MTAASWLLTAPLRTMMSAGGSKSTCSGFIQEEDGGVAHQAAGHAQAALLAS